MVGKIDCDGNDSGLIDLFSNLVTGEFPPGSPSQRNSQILDIWYESESSRISVIFNQYLGRLGGGPPIR
jgi:hypothetical protein